MSPKFTDSGNVKLSKKEYDALTAQNKHLKERVSFWKTLAQSAMGNLRAIATNMDAELSKWVGDEDETDLTQKL